MEEKPILYKVGDKQSQRVVSKIVTAIDCKVRVMQISCVLSVAKDDRATLISQRTNTIY